MYKLYVDGSACFGGTPNPRKGQRAFISCGWCIDKNDQLYDEFYLPLGYGTVNQAEYASLIHGLNRLKELGIKEADVFMDSFIVVHIVNRRDHIKKSKIDGANIWTPKIQKYIDKNFDRLSLSWIPRKQNKAHEVIERWKFIGQQQGVANFLN